MYEQAFVFHCYPPHCCAYSNDGNSYTNFRSALVAARHFINQEMAIKALLTVVEDWLEAGQITETEYWNLTAFD